MMMEETGFSEKKLLMKEKNGRKSYGTIVQTSRSGLLSPTTATIRHDLAPDDTLQGISLKYGVKMEDIRRANRLLPTDSIFMRAYLLIPVDEESDLALLKSNHQSPHAVVRSQSLQSDVATSSSGSSRSTTEFPTTDPDEENRRDVENFLSKLDSSIASTKRNLEETRKHSDFSDEAITSPSSTTSPYQDHGAMASSSSLDESLTDANNTNGNRVTYEGAYQSLNRVNAQHPDRRRIRNSLHRLEKTHDELYEL